MGPSRMAIHAWGGGGRLDEDEEEDDEEEEEEDGKGRAFPNTMLPSDTNGGMSSPIHTFANILCGSVKKRNVVTRPIKRILSILNRKVRTQNKSETLVSGA